MQPGGIVRSIDVGYKPAAVYESRAKAIYWDGRNEFGEWGGKWNLFLHPDSRRLFRNAENADSEVNFPLLVGTVDLYGQFPISAQW